MKERFAAKRIPDIRVGVLAWLALWLGSAAAPACSEGKTEETGTDTGTVSASEPQTNEPTGEATATTDEGTEEMTASETQTNVSTATTDEGTETADSGSGATDEETEEVTDAGTDTATFDAGDDWERVTEDAGWLKRSGAAGTVFNGRMWIIGGFCGDDDGPRFYCLNDVWSSEDGEEWNEVLPYSKTPAAGQFPGLCGHTAVAFDGKMWVMGGYGDDMKQRSEVWSSSDGATWKLETDEPGWLAREEHASAVYDGAMWVIGGYGKDAAGYSTDFKDAWSSEDGVSWTAATEAAGWSARRSHVALVHDGGHGEALWVLGGMGGGIMFPTFSDEVWSSADGAAWEQEEVDFGFYARNSPVGLEYGGKMWILGGISAEHNSISASVDGATWDEVTTDAPFEARMEAVGLVFKGRMWLLGGTYVTTESVYYSDVWASK